MQRVGWDVYQGHHGSKLMEYPIKNKAHTQA